MRAKLGGPKAITATAHKLARVVYHLLVTGQSYDESVFLKYEASHRDRLQKRLHAQAAALGFTLVPTAVVPNITTLCSYGPFRRTC
jgi:acyl CoA:acetate/3-ketoacid CoA transferase alpha subunit